MSIIRVNSTSNQFGIDWDCTLEFDTEKTTEYGGKIYTLDENLRSSLDFFSGGEEVLEESNGNLYIAYAKFISKKILIESMDWNVSGIIDQFKDSEGYLELDGSQGVTLIYADGFEIDNDFSAAEIK